MSISISSGIHNRTANLISDPSNELSPLIMSYLNPIELLDLSSTNSKVREACNIGFQQIAQCRDEVTVQMKKDLVASICFYSAKNQEQLQYLTALFFKKNI
ncbi:MAG: hypothetical protein ACI9S8_002487 [Chlamydiales bacterium]|jgi:hypothetical protein